jgi:hypothetical protein
LADLLVEDAFFIHVVGCSTAMPSGTRAKRWKEIQSKTGKTGSAIHTVRPRTAPEAPPTGRGAGEAGAVLTPKSQIRQYRQGKTRAARREVQDERCKTRGADKRELQCQDRGHD